MEASSQNAGRKRKKKKFLLQKYLSSNAAYVCLIEMYRIPLVSLKLLIYGIVSAKRDLAHIIKFPVRAIELDACLKCTCMANKKFRALQLHDRYSDS